MADFRFAAGLVLGGSSGIGAAVVGRLARSTDALHVASRRGTTPDFDARECLVRGHRLDAREYDEMAGLLDNLGPLDWIVNCVGVGYYAPLTSNYSAAWREILDINVIALANLLSLLERSQPNVSILVNVSSLAAHQPSTTPGNSLYSAAKTAARTLLDQYRDDLRRRGSPLRVASVSPGYVRGTGFNARFFDHAPQRAVDLFEGHASLRPDDVAALIECALLLPAHVELSEVVMRPVPSPEGEAG